MGWKMAAANLGEDLIVSIDSVDRKDDSAGNSDLRFPSFSEVEQDSWVKVNVTESFKVVVLGDSQVGKTSLAHLFSKERALTHSMTTIGFEPFDKHVRTGDRIVKLILWDTAGQERFRSRGGLVPMFYRGADAAVFVYDVTDQSSFTSVEDWYREMSFHCDTNDVVLALVGNKTDMVDSRVVEREKAEMLAERRHMLYREVSCVSDENLPRVTELFTELAERLIAAKERESAIHSIRQRPIKVGEEAGEWVIINDTNMPAHVDRRGNRSCRC